jgi:hypothetical protein
VLGAGCCSQISWSDERDEGRRSSRVRVVVVVVFLVFETRRVVLVVRPWFDKSNIYRLRPSVTRIFEFFSPRMYVCIYYVHT